MQRFDAQIAEGNGSVVALQHDRPERRFVFEARAARRPSDLRVFVDELAILPDFDEPAVLSFFAGVIKSGCTKNDVERLPFAGTTAGVETRRMAVVAFAVIPTLIDAAAVAVFQVIVGHAPTVEDLHFVTALNVNAGVGIGRDIEFNVNGGVAVLELGHQVALLAGRAVHENSRAGMNYEKMRVLGIERNGFGHRPAWTRIAPLRKILAIEKTDGI